MSNYRRAWHPDGTYFFTVNLLERHGNDLLIRHIDALRTAVRTSRQSHLFIIHCWVVLNDWRGVPTRRWRKALRFDCALRAEFT